jgi:hypothetical protein
MKLKDYTVVTDNGSQLREKVMKMAEQGFVPIGGVAVSISKNEKGELVPTFHQAMGLPAN